MTVGERKVVTVAVMSCGCEYVTLAASRPPSKCPEHGGTLALVRYDTEAPAQEADHE